MRKYQKLGCVLAFMSSIYFCKAGDLDGMVEEIELDAKALESIQTGGSAVKTPSPTPKPVTRSAPAAPTPKAATTNAAPSKTHTAPKTTAKTKSSPQVPLKAFKDFNAQEESRAPARISIPSGGDDFYSKTTAKILEYSDRVYAQKESNNFFKRVFGSSSGNVAQGTKLGNLKFPNGQNLIHYLMHEILIDPRILDWLISQGVDPFQKNDLGMDPLTHLIALYPPTYPNYELIIEKFKSHIRARNIALQQDDVGRTAIHWAAIMNNKVAMKSLLNGIDYRALQVQDSAGYYANEARAKGAGFIPIDYTNPSAFSKESVSVAPVPSQPKFASTSEDPLGEILRTGQYPRALNTINSSYPMDRSEIQSMLLNAKSYKSKFELQQAIQRQQWEAQQQQPRR